MYYYMMTATTDKTAIPCLFTSRPIPTTRSAVDRPRGFSSRTFLLFYPLTKCKEQHSTNTCFHMISCKPHPVSEK